METDDTDKISKEEEKPATEGVDSVDSSGSKSSPFHGFSSQEEADGAAAADSKDNTEAVSESNDKKADSTEEVSNKKEDEMKNEKVELKSQLLADFGIGNDASEEDVSDSNLSEKGEEKKELKSQLLEDFGIGNEASEEDDNETDEEKKNVNETSAGEETSEETEIAVPESEKKEVKDVDKQISEDIDKPVEKIEDAVDEGEKAMDVDEDETLSNDLRTENDEIDNELRQEERKTVITKKVSPLKIGQLKNSPKKVHFSPEVDFREQSKDEELSNLDSTPKSSLKKTNNSSETSPPLKLKIKFGKDKSGTITHVKINEKSEDKVESSEEKFHGFEDSEIPDWVVDSFDKLDLKSNFHIKPTVYVSISSKKTQKQLEEPQLSSSKPPAEDLAPIPKLVLSVGNNLTPSPSLSKKERRKKSDNLNFVKPLWDGWYREIVWRPMTSDPSKKDADVYYYPPNPPGQKTLRYKTTTELEAFLITSGSMYPISFFTFKKELVGGPEGWEAERHVEAAERPLPVAKESLPAELGKRVSKPPEKLIMETEKEPDTPTRSSKRTIRPPDKFDVDQSSPGQPPAKQIKLDSSAVSDKPPVLTPQKKLTSVPVPDSSPTTSSSSAAAAEKSGTLKLKTFSKMNVKNQLSTAAAASSNKSKTEREEDIVVLDEGLTKEPVIPLSHSGMTITKVKKSTTDTINLPGMPTIGPPPLSYGGPCGVIPVPGQSQTPSSISITPLSSHPRGHPNLHPPPGLHQTNTKKIVRPGVATSVFCSIHCPGVTGFPSLSCTSCHCLFHPKCVGVSTQVANNPNSEFYCNDCQPPPPQPPFPANLIPVPPPLHLQKNQVSVSSNKRKEPPGLHPLQPSQPKTADQKQAQKKEPVPPRPFEGQSMINVAGRKFLVIPHPVIESPPPSPPLTNQNQPQSSSSSASTNQKQKNEKLNVMLKPADIDSKMPCFDVEMTQDGKYLLIPKDSTKKNVFKDNKESKSESNSSSPSSGEHFNQNLSYGYSAIMEVFKYLSVRERATAARVCKLWRDVSLHYSLWKNISLKNTRIHDWEGFVQFFNKTKSDSLDMRKMLFVKDRDQTWQEIAGVAPDFLSLTKVELPKVNGPILTEILTSWTKLETLNAPFVTAPFDVTTLSGLTNLKEVKLKASTGSNIQVTSRLFPLTSLCPKITHLSLLGLEGLQEQDYDVFGTMVHLQLLELGDCSTAPGCFFKTVSELSKLEKLRLEKGSVDVNIAKLANTPKLMQVELIDFQVLPGFKEGLKPIKNIQKMLLIPQYKDEVAKINTEIVDGITQEMEQLTSFYLGVTNEWLEAMLIAAGGNKVTDFTLLLKILTQIYI